MLLAHYKLDDNAANTTVTATVGVNGFVKVGGNTADLRVAAGAGPGGALANAGFKFDGVDDHVECPDPKNGADSFLGGNAYTIAFWIYRRQTTSAIAVPLGNYNGTTGTSWYMHLFATTTAYRTIRVQQEQALDDKLIYTGPTNNWINGKWRHLAWTRVNGSKFELYLDGELLNSKVEAGDLNFTAEPAYNTPFYIGAQEWDGVAYNPIWADIADVRIYDSDESGNLDSIIDDARPSLSMTISGTARVGQTLTATPLTNDATATIFYEWYRSNDVLGNGRTPIPGATSSTYVATSADIDKYITCAGVARNTGGRQLDSYTAWSNYTAAVVDSVPIARYKLDETSGTAIADSAGSNNGTASRDASLLHVGAGNGPGGELVDAGFYFNPDLLDQINLAGPVSISPPLTISYWIKIPAWPEIAKYVFDARDALGDGFGAYIYNPGGGLPYEAGINVNSATGGPGAVPGRQVGGDVWRHVLCRYAGSANNSYIWVDGVSTGNNQTWTSQVISTTIAAVIGNRSYDSAYPFEGAIADLRIYDTDESANVATIRQAGMPRATTPEVAGVYGDTTALRTVVGKALTASATCNDHTATADWKWYRYSSRDNAKNNTSPTQVATTAGFSATSSEGGTWIVASVAYTNVGGAGLTGPRTYSEPIHVEPVPVAHWKLDDTSGTTVVATQGANGTKAGGDIVGVGTGNGPGGELVNVGQVFDGVDDHIDTSHVLAISTRPLSMALWFKPAQLTADKLLLDCRDGTDLGLGLWLDKLTNAESYPALAIGSTYPAATIAAREYEWRHLAFVWLGTNTYYLYFDGEQILTGSASYNTAITATTRIGAQSFDNAAKFPGSIADVRIYNADIRDALPTLLHIARPTCAPALSGTAQVGETLTCTITSNDSTATFEYQWYRADDANGLNETTIGGATASTYAAQAADEGKRLRCRGRSTNVGGAGMQSSYVYTDYTVAVAASGGGHSLTATGLSSGTPVLNSPALAQNHVFTASALNSGTPVLDSPALTQTHVLTASALTSGTPTLGSPSLGIQGTLVPDPLSAGTPTLASPSLSQTHVLTASALSAGSPTLASPSLAQTHPLIASPLSAGTPTLASPVLSQVHVFTANPLTSGTPELASPVLGQPGQIAANPLSTGAPTLGTPVLSQTHVFTANALTAGAPTLASPVLSQLHVLGADGASAGSPTLGSPALSVIHNLVPSALSSGTPVLDSPILGIDGLMTALPLDAGTPTLDSPTLSQIHILSLVSLSTGLPTLPTPLLNWDLIPYTPSYLRTFYPSISLPERTVPQISFGNRTFSLPYYSGRTFPQVPYDIRTGIPHGS